jgi:parallel beta-helix repeat protein
VAKFVRPGTPAGWITLKNYPGHAPVLSAHGQQAINIKQVKGSPTLAYLEVRGLHIRGNGDTVREQFPDEVGKSTPNTDVMGIHINGRTTPYPGERTPGEMVHNIRLADNLVEFCTADGIYVQYCDWLFVENNTVRNNCWFTTGYAPAGFAVMGYANFDGVDDGFKMLIAGNQVYGNRLTVPNQPGGQAKKTSYFNGNGILLDANAEKPPAVYLGRTLVQNNLVFNNGGGGIQMWGSHRLDIVNNTLYHNGATPELKWGQFGVDMCRDVRIVNNVVVAQADRPLDSWFVGQKDRKTAYILRMNNLFWGGAKPNIEGINDLVADPLFVNASTNASMADFRLQPGSPALRAGRWEMFSPVIDLDGKLRPVNTSADLGAFQH